MKAVELDELKHVFRIKAVVALQVLLGIIMIFGNFMGTALSNIPSYLMELVLIAAVVLIAAQMGEHMASKRKTVIP